MTRQQRWANTAYRIVRAVAEEKKEASEKKYASRCMQAPSLLQRAGLVQSLVFWGKDDDNKRFRDDVAKVLDVRDAGSGDALLRLVLEAPSDRYILLSRDVAAVTLWLRRFAQSELKHEDDA